MNYIGIDPGKSGGIAVLCEGHISTLPLAKATERDIWNFILAFRHDSTAMIEKVASSPQMGVVSAFTFGRSLGFLRGMLTALEVRFDEVSPQRWQKEIGCLTKGDKNVSKAKAQQLFPTLIVTHATADALLLAEYAKRKSVAT